MKTNIYFYTLIIYLLFSTTLTAQGWEKLYPNLIQGNSPSAEHVIPGNNGSFHVLITKDYEEESVLMNIDSVGTIQMTTTLNSNAVDMITASNGDIIILSKLGDYDTGISISFLRVDDNHNIIAETISSATENNNSPYAITESSDGTFWLIGHSSNYPVSTFLQKLDSQGQLINQAIYDEFEYFHARKILAVQGGGVRVVGYGRPNNTGYYKTFIKEYDINGTFINQLIYENTNSQLIMSDIIETADGGFLITANNQKPLLIKTDNAGIELWRNEYTVSNFLFLTGLSENNSGTGYRLLYREQQSGFPQHSGIIDTDLQGNWLWKKEFATHYFNEGQDLINLPDNGTLIVGHRGREINNPYDTYPKIPFIIRTDSQGNTFRSGILGNVTNDYTDNCMGDDIDLAIGKYVSVYQDGISVSGAPVDSLGNYFIPTNPDSYKLAVELPNFLWNSCQDSIDAVILENDTLENQNFVIAYNNEPLDSIYGYLFEDYDHDCVRDSFENIGYDRWVVHLNIQEGNNSLSLNDTTDITGLYSFTNLNGFTNGAYAFLYFEPAIGTGLTCSIPCWQEIGLGPFLETSVEFNNGMHCDTLPFCPIMSATLATNEIRPCMDGSYFVHYCNIGGVTAEDIYLDVTIDTALAVISSSIPWETQSDNVYTFQLDDLLSNECNSFHIDFIAPCDDPVGTTYCSEVYAYPDSTCAPISPLWDGSEIELSIECQGDSVEFRIQNIGTSNMLEPSEFIVIEDNVLLYSEPQPFQLDAGEILEINQATNGSFYYMKAQQVEGFPGADTPIVWVEGCGISQMANLGFTNQYPLGDEDTWHDIFCLESTNSFDPNDKNGFPRGLGDEHFIDANEPLEYIIRFQNTGTAEALYVEIRDTISSDFLDLASIRVGASSHSYTWDIEGNGVLVFKFEDINLPYEDFDEEGSNGFIQFIINQKTDLPIGTIINNTAAIYFDNNSPIITNQTWHTIGENYLSTWVKDIPSEQLLDIIVYPNPTKDLIKIDVKKLPFGEKLKLELYDVLGRNTNNISFENNTVINLKQSSGTYFYKVYNSEQLIGVGKLMKL